MHWRQQVRREMRDIYVSGIVLFLGLWGLILAIEPVVTVALWLWVLKPPVPRRFLGVGINVVVLCAAYGISEDLVRAGIYSDPQRCAAMIVFGLSSLSHLSSHLGNNHALAEYLVRTGQLEEYGRSGEIDFSRTLTPPPSASTIASASNVGGDHGR